jgi:hypothetical protein
MAEEFEDPIEAIKRRNEERARRLKERIASGEFDRFETPLEEVDESLPSGPGAIEAPESDFDLSSFPAPPEPSAISFDEEREAPLAEPMPAAPPEFAPPPEPEGAAEEPELAPPPEVEAGVPEPELAPPSAPEPMAEVVSGMDLTELDLGGMGEFVAPEPWDVEAPAPPLAEELPPIPEEVPAAEISPDLEIEVEPVAAAPLEEVTVSEREEEEVVAAAAEVGEPTLGEEEAEAIKATIEEELREIPPAAPPMPPRPEEVPVGYEAEAEIAAPAAKEVAEIFIGIEVEGNKVRIERRNITLAATVDLFRSIIDRYQNK